MINYTTQAQATADPVGTKDKKIVSDDAFAIVDLIDKLIDKIEQARLSLI